jgi:hypothetical protein
MCQQGEKDQCSFIFLTFNTYVAVFLIISDAINRPGPRPGNVLMMFSVALKNRSKTTWKWH